MYYPLYTSTHHYKPPYSLHITPTTSTTSTISTTRTAILYHSYVLSLHMVHDTLVCPTCHLPCLIASSPIHILALHHHLYASFLHHIYPTTLLLFHSFLHIGQ